MRKVMALLLVTALFAVFGTAVFAADIELDSKGSISVTFKDSETGELVTDGILSMYKAANIVSDAEGNLSYAYTDDFASCELVLGDLSEDTLPASLVAYAQQNELTAVSQNVGENGVCLFEDLELGLYVIMQTKAAEGYYAVAPFLVSVPIADTDGWDYDIDATPKMEKLTATTTSTTESTASSTSSSTSYTTTSTIDSNVNGGDDSSSLPQTGQLNWPVPVLAGLGVLLFLFGWTVVFAGKKERR